MTKTGATNLRNKIILFNEESYCSTSSTEISTNDGKQHRRSIEYLNHYAS